MKRLDRIEITVRKCKTIIDIIHLYDWCEVIRDMTDRASIKVMLKSGKGMISLESEVVINADSLEYMTYDAKHYSMQVLENGLIIMKRRK